MGVALTPEGVGRVEIVGYPKGVSVPPPTKESVGRKERVESKVRVGKKGERVVVDVAPPCSIRDPVGLKEGEDDGVERRRALGVEVEAPPSVVPVPLEEGDGGLLGRELVVPPPPPGPINGGKEGDESEDGV